MRSTIYENHYFTGKKMNRDTDTFPIWQLPYYLPENQIKGPEGVKEFSGQDYRYVRELSDEKRMFL